MLRFRCFLGGWLPVITVREVHRSERRKFAHSKVVHRECKHEFPEDARGNRVGEVELHVHTQNRGAIRLWLCHKSFCRHCCNFVCFDFMSFIFSILWKHQRLEKEPSIAIHRNPSPSIPSAHSCHSLMYHDVPYRSVTARGTDAVVLRSSVRSVASTMAWIFRAATPTLCAPSWALKSSEAPWNWKKWNLIEMFSDIVAIPSHYASQMEVSGFIEFCFLSTSCTVFASLVSVQKRMCVSLFEADWQYEYRIAKQDFPIWKRLFFI